GSGGAADGMLRFGFLRSPMERAAAQVNSNAARASMMPQGPGRGVEVVSRSPAGDRRLGDALDQRDGGLLQWCRWSLCGNSDRKRARDPRLHDGSRDEFAGDVGTVERTRGKHGRAVTLSDELEDRRYRVDLHRDLRPLTELGEARLNQHSDRVRPARDDQRMPRKLRERHGPGAGGL